MENLPVPDFELVPILLSQVCRLWRAFVLAHPALGASLNIECSDRLLPPLHVIRTHLLRSAAHPLSIVLEAEGLNLDFQWSHVQRNEADIHGPNYQDSSWGPITPSCSKSRTSSKSPQRPSTTGQTVLTFRSDPDQLWIAGIA
ncbi:hypothetical protein BD779DRAFT_1676152 [Infundibulicybe gibba]|nr:hypothetical protein BD779DRAFT_1676152 [Infundibulicybe gibba]